VKARSRVMRSGSFVENAAVPFVSRFYACAATSWRFRGSLITWKSTSSSAC
jgi:hypothetical protein